MPGPVPVRGGHGPRASGRGPPVLLQAVDQRASAGDCLKLGAALAERAPRVALLAMGDASARRARDTEGAPDPQAQDYDEEVAEALAAADARWLGRLDPALDDELMVAGRAAWQVLAGAAAGARMCGRLLLHGPAPTASRTWSPPGRNPRRTEAMPERVIAVVGPDRGREVRAGAAAWPWRSAARW